jgi:hypothetical protein
MRRAVLPGAVAAFAITAALLCLPYRSAKAEGGNTLDCTGFVLRDSKGNTRIQMGCDNETGSPVVFLYDGAGKERLMLRVRENEGPSVSFFGRGGQVAGKTSNGDRLTIRYSDEQDAPEILIRDEKGNPRAQFISDKQGKVVLRFQDEKGKAKSFP